MPLTAEFIQDVVSAHTSRMDRAKPRMQKHRDAYLTRFWDHQGSGDYQEDGLVRVEVNRLYGFVEAYVGSLFPKSPRVVFGPDVSGQGDAEKGQIAANRWLETSDIYQRLESAIRQSLLYPGSALKIGLDLTKKDPKDRIWVHLLPWWELIVDHDVHDVGEQRFIGHMYWENEDALRRRFEGLPDELQTSSRVPFFEGRGKPSASKRKKGHPTEGSSNESFVRVLEFYNLVDDWTEGAQPLRGVFEVYLPDQKDGLQLEPIHRGPFPFDKPNGDPLAPIFPLIFNHVPEHPLQGTAAVERVYQQARELNLLRSHWANAVRRDSRQMLVRKDAGIDEESLAKFTQGQDGAIIPVEGSAPLSTLVFPIQFQPLNVNHQIYENQIEQDFDQGSASAPFTRGVATRATATEVNRLHDYTETEIGRHARRMDVWISNVVEGYVRALIAALRIEVPDSYDEVVEQRVEDPIVLQFRKGAGPIIEIATRDLDANFSIEIVDAASTPLSKEARRVNFMNLAPTILQLWEQVQEGNAMAGRIMKYLVELFEFPADFDPANVLEDIGQGEQPIGPPDEIVQAKLKEASKSGAAAPAEQAGAPPQPPVSPQGPAGPPAQGQGPGGDVAAMLQQLPPEVRQAIMQRMAAGGGGPTLPEGEA